MYENRAITYKDYKGGINNKVEPLLINNNELQDLQNVWVDETYGITAAKGFEKKIILPSGKPALDLFTFLKDNGTEYLLASDGKILYYSIDGTSLTEIKTDLNPDYELSFEVFRNKCWMTNGYNAVFSFDGISIVVYDGTGTLPNIPIGKYIKLHKDMLFIANTEDDSSELIWHDVTKNPEAVDGWPSENSIFISKQDGDNINGIYSFSGELVILKSKSMWYVHGDQSEFAGLKGSYPTIRKIDSPVGTAWNRSLQIYNNNLIFMAYDGIYAFDGSKVERISDKIETTFKGLEQPNIKSNYLEFNALSDWLNNILKNNIDFYSTEGSIKRVTQKEDDLDADFNAGTKDDSILITNDKIKLKTTLDLVIEQALSDMGDTGHYGQTFKIIAETYETINIKKISVKYQTFSAGTYRFNLNYYATVPVEDSVGITPDYTTNITVYLGVGITKIDIPVDIDITPNEDHAFSVYEDLSGLLPKIFYKNSDVYANGFMIYYLLKWYYSALDLEFYIDYDVFAPTGVFESRQFDTGSLNVLGNWRMFNVVQNVVSGSLIAYEIWQYNLGDAENYIHIIPGDAPAQVEKRYFKYRVTLTRDGIQDVYVDTVTQDFSLRAEWRSEIKYVPFISKYQNIDISSTQIDSLTILIKGSNNADMSGFPDLAQGTDWIAVNDGDNLNTIFNNVIYKYFQFDVVFQSDYSYYDTSIVNLIRINYLIGGLTNIRIASIYYNRRYWLAVAKLGSLYNDLILVLDTRVAWVKKDFNITSMTIFRNQLYGGDSVDNYIHLLDNGYTKDTNVMNFIIQTKNEDCDLPANEKLFKYVYVGIKKIGTNKLYFSWSIDGGAYSSIEEVLINATEGAIDKSRIILPSQSHGKYISFKFTGIQQFEIYDISLIYQAYRIR